MFHSQLAASLKTLMNSVSSESSSTMHRLLTSSSPFARAWTPLMFFNVLIDITVAQSSKLVHSLPIIRSRWFLQVSSKTGALSTLLSLERALLKSDIHSRTSRCLSEAGDLRYANDRCSWQLDNALLETCDLKTLWDIFGIDGGVTVWLSLL